MSDGRLYILAGPVVALVVSGVFLLVWLQDRKRRYVLFFAASFCAYAVAVLSQLLHVPAHVGHNALVSAAIYTLSIFCLVEGVLLRYGRGGTWLLLAGVSVAILLLLSYFMYVDQNLVARIYIQNFGYGALFVITSAWIFPVGGRRVDRIVFWVFLLFGLHFFVRTVLTMSLSPEIYAIDRMWGDGSNRQAMSALFNSTPFWQVLNFSVLVSGFLLALALLAAIAADAMDDLKREGGLDPLTGLANRRGFDDQAKARLDAAARQPLSLVYCDIDRFKAVNDTFGHAVGDLVLASVGSLIARLVRPQDVAARRGGEEFVILLAGTDAPGASLFAERIRTELRRTAFAMLPAGWTVTASFGVAERRPGEDLVSLLHRADQLVYAAKHSGRDRVVSDDLASSARPAGHGAA